MTIYRRKTCLYLKLCRTLFINHYLGDLEEFCLYQGGNTGFTASKINEGDKGGKLLSTTGK